MKIILIAPVSDTVHHYRANLHCHSTVSDGAKTPEQLKEFYAAHGYSVLAYTDHEVFITHNELTDEHFLALNGYEIGCGGSKYVHICMIAPTPETVIDPCYHRTKYIGADQEKYRVRIRYDESLPDFERVYTHEGVSEIARYGRDAGFFVTYNHPCFSAEEYPEYSGYHGFSAMEIANYGSRVFGFEEDNGRVYQDMLNLGNRLYCIATDDNHNRGADCTAASDSFGGAVVIFAEKLDYLTIMDALKKGHFYAVTGTSTHRGPEIRSLTFENGNVTVETSPVRQINYLPHSPRAARMVHAEEGKTVTRATFHVWEEEPWFRITVTDTAGYRAYTNAYFPDRDWFTEN